MIRIVIVLLAACGTAANTSSQRTLTLDSIPQGAASTLKRLSAGAKIEHITTEREGGVEVYEATWHVNGLEHEVAVTAMGQVVESEEEVASVNVPSAVRATALAKLPQGSSIKFIKLQSGNFEAEAMVDGREHEVNIAPDGREVRGDDDDDDDDDDSDD